MLIVALSIAIANPAAPEPLDFVFTPPAGTTFVAPQTGPGAWCSRAYVVDEGGACVEGELGGVHARIVLESIEAGGGPSFRAEGGEGRCSGLATLHSFHAAYADGR